MLLDVAAFEDGLGLGPAAGVGGAGGDVLGDGGAGEEPDGDLRRGDLGGIDAALGAVEAGAVRGGVGGLDAATLVVAVGDVAVGVGYGAAHGDARGDAAAGVGVQGRLVAGLVVDAFNDVDFAFVGPVRADEPEGRPRSLVGC